MASVQPSEKVALHERFTCKVRLVENFGEVWENEGDRGGRIEPTKGADVDGEREARSI